MKDLLAVEGEIDSVGDMELRLGGVLEVEGDAL